MTKISIIIPVLNEGNSISDLIRYLKTHSYSPQHLELIIVDGGSEDDTISQINMFNHISVLNSERGRAKQMNLGAKSATGEVLYFLHADSFPPKNFDLHIVNEISKDHKSGCFKMIFDSNHWWLKLVGWFTQFNWRICRGGDQSLFIDRELFDQLGGFDENYVIYEDNILIGKLYKINAFTVIDKNIISSSRRYKTHGIWKLQWHYLMIHLKHFFGASAQDLQNYYLNKIN